ncbi:MAG: uracil phosphoribosyltransferase [Phycisphaerales bacterium]
MQASPERHPNLRVLDHPLIGVKLTRARDRATPPADFRRLIDEIAGLMTFEACKHLQTEATSVETPLETTTGTSLARTITVVPILRAGMGMTDGMLALLPEARVGHIGLYRDEERMEPVTYYCKLPKDVADSQVLLVDPMLATGGSASFAVQRLKEEGCRDIRLICLVVAPPGVERMAADHPDVTILTAALDERLDDRCFIRPGLGDAGDRIFGTA